VFASLGKADFTFFYPYGGNRSLVRDGKRTPIPREQWGTLRMEEQFDAVLHLGAPSSLTMSNLPKLLCADTSYRQMRSDD
jgi:hypothetical protein